MSPRPKRSDQHPDLGAAIKETAWQQIAERGAPALNLRAIARALNITAPAIYNYFPDRDALVTALVIDAYTSFGDSQIEACEAIPPADLPGRLLAIGLAYRRWALSHPEHYQLIFGTPIPGYIAPREQVQPSAARSISALTRVVQGLRGAGKLVAPNMPELNQDLRPEFEAWKAHYEDVDLISLSVVLLIWARVHGLVSLEISGNLPPFGPDGEALYLYEMQAIKGQFIE